MTDLINAAFRWGKRNMVFGLLLCGSILAGQESVDTITLVRQLKEQGKTREASHLLATWVETHPPQSDVFWLYAQNEYWRKNFKKSRKLYQKALELDSLNLYLQLDYAHSLLNMGRFAQANNLLKKLSPEAQKDPYARFVGAKRLFWSGDLKEAQHLAQASFGSGFADATVLEHDIDAAMKPWMRLALQYSSDSQPLENLMPVLEVGVFSSKWVDMRVVATPQQFFIDDVAVNIFRAGFYNRFHIPKTRTVIGLSAGMMQPKEDDVVWTGGAEVEQSLPGGWQLSAGWQVKPYLETRASIDTGLSFQQSKFEINWQEPHGFQVNLFVLNDVFPDNNQILTYGGWMLSPSLKWWRCALRAGYAYSNSDAAESRYATDQSLEDILNRPDPSAPIPGDYMPYFTPENMVTHAVLGVLDFKPASWLTFTFNGKYGFAATADNPYLYLDQDNEGELTIARAFENTAFTPFEYGGKMNIHITESLDLVTNYQFSRIFFYDLQTAGIGMKLSF